MGIFNNKYPYTDFHELNADWIIELMKKLGINVDSLKEALEDFKEDTEAQLKIINEWIANYDDSFMKAEIEKYIATMIFPEITDAGFIVYNIPDSWDEIVFNTTDLDISIPGVDYGHLVLSY